MMSQIEAELARIQARQITTSESREFEPEVGTLVRVELETAYWHLLPKHLLNLLEELPDRAGDEAVRVAIERNAVFVWHGPSPEGSRDPV